MYDTKREMMTEVEALEKQLSDGATITVDGQIFTALDLRLRAEYDQSLTRRIKAKRVTLERLDEIIAEKRAELVEAMRAVKSLEQLRQRHEERYWRSQNVTQQRFTDEIAQRKYVQPESRKKIPS